MPATPGPIITGLREKPRERVLVELDGTPWRVLPADAVVRAGLHEGLVLDRPSLRVLRRELRRSEALAAAARALRTRDLSAQAVEERLGRAGVPPSARREALQALGRAGVVDDSRLAASTARALAARGWGDAAIADRLEQVGIAGDDAGSALAALEPEDRRAERIVAARGRTIGTARFLARRGFSPDVVEDVSDHLLADMP